MKVAILPGRTELHGGPLTFYNKIEEALISKGHRLVTPEQSEIVLVIISYNINYLKDIKKLGVKLIQRLDGIYTPYVSPLAFRHKNSKMRYIYKELADGIVFQSNFSKWLVEKYWGKISKPSSIIFNGVDVRKFSPIKSKKCFRNDNIKIITTGIYRHPSQLLPAIKAFDYLRKQNYAFHYTVVGPIENKPNMRKIMKMINEYSRKYKDTFQYVPFISNDKLPEILRNHNIYLFPTLSAPCPNSVIEAMSCGLAVVSFKSGSLPEIIGNSDLLVERNLTNLKLTVDAYSYINLAHKIIEISKKIDEYSSLMRLRVLDKFSLQIMADNYIAFFNRMIEGKDE